MSKNVDCKYKYRNLDSEHPKRLSCINQAKILNSLVEGETDLSKIQTNELRGYHFMTTTQKSCKQCSYVKTPGLLDDF